MIIKPYSTKTTIVLLGHFNPLIFKPHWFSKNGVIGDDEAENADIDVIHSEIVRFGLEWLSVAVDKQRFSAEVTQPPNIRLFDFVMKTFGELLQHTPVGAMGINLQVEFDAGSQDNRNKIGYTLAPPEAWGEWAADIRKVDGKFSGGMTALTMRQSVVDGRAKGFTQTRVEPSKHSDSMVFIEVNDHFAVEDGNNLDGCHEVIGYLNDNFESSTVKAEWIVNQVMGIV